MLEEVFNSILSNKARSFLTSLGIIWGMLILIVLVGIGKGFQLGVLEQFKAFSKKTLYVISGKTNEGTSGNSGRVLLFSEIDLKNLLKVIPAIKDISPEVVENAVVTNAGYSANLDIKAISLNYLKIKLLDIAEGRLLNEADFVGKRKVVLIGKDVAVQLFGNHSNIVGKKINIKGVYYTIIGIIKTNLLTMLENRAIYIPLSSYSVYFNRQLKINIIVLSIRDGFDTKAVEKRIEFYMANKYDFNPNDKHAFIFNNVEDQVKMFNSFFTGLGRFLWFMGISCLLSGIIGVGNIMYTVAKERTREIGIRKAVGAKNTQIMCLFISESIIITSVAGALGVITGMVVLKIIGLSMDVNEENSIFQTPQIDFKLIFGAAIILIFSGTIAGCVPAFYAAKLKPIDALKQE